ncbi:MAG: diphthine synthase [Fervidicoccaceae archaeon]
MRKPVIYFIGAGLAPSHVTLEALSALSSVDLILVETYTSFVDWDLTALIKRIAPFAEVVPVSRKLLEENSEEVIKEAIERGALAVVSPGDPFVATTHTALRLEAAKRGVKAIYVPGTSALHYAFSAACLSIYKLGGCATVVYPKWGILSESAYLLVQMNRERGRHTFLFLDLDEELGPMDPSQALRLLLEAQRRLGGSALSPSEKIVVLQRLGLPRERIYYVTIESALSREWRDPPYSIIILGQLHPVESECLEVVSRDE